MNQDYLASVVLDCAFFVLLQIAYDDSDGLYMNEADFRSLLHLRDHGTYLQILTWCDRFSDDDRKVLHDRAMLAMGCTP